MKKSVQIIEPHQYIPVKKEFISKTNIKQLAKTAERRQKVIRDFIGFIKNQQKIIRENCDRLGQKNFLIFNEYIDDAFDMINSCWGEEMIKLCNERLKAFDDFLHDPELQQSLPLQFTQYQSQKFESMQQQLINQIKQQQKQIELFLETADKYQQDRQRTLNYFNSHFFRQPYAQLSKWYNMIEQSNNKNKKLIIRLQKNKMRYLSVFNNFRRIIVRNRVLSQKKFYEMCNSLIDAFIKTIQTQYSKLKRVKEVLKKQSVIYQDKQKYEFFNKASSEDIFSICSCTKDIYQTIYDIVKLSKSERVKFNQKIQELLKIQDNIPSNALNFILQTFQKMYGRHTQIANNLSQKIKLLDKEELKVNDISTNISITAIQNGIKKTKISTIPEIINEIINEIIDPLSKLVCWVQGQLIKDKKMYLGDDNFNNDITQFNNDNSVEQVHQQHMWMFENWQQTKLIKLQSLDKIKNKLNKIKSLIEAQRKVEGIEIMQAQKCYMFVSPSSDKKGILYTYQNCVKFISPDSIQLKIPYESINNVKVKLQGFKLNMFLYTPKGRIMFINPPRAIKCKQKILQKIKPRNTSQFDYQDNNSDDVQTVKQNVPKWKSVEVSSQQISAIQSKKSKILSQLPDINNWIQAHPNHVFKNMTIDQIFNEFYSDIPKQISGKKYDSFNAYLLGILQNKDIQDGKFTTKGPKFYLQQNSQTFQNCPSFSQRTNNYEHPLSGLPIPFLPKYCKCKQVIKIYWISHQQFAMVLDGYSSGAPMTDSFYVKILHHAKKNGNDVQISYRGTVVFTKDTSFKSVLQKKCLQQIKDNLLKTIKVQQSRIKFLQSSAKGQPQIEQQLTVNQTKISAKTSSNILDNSNSMVVIVGIIGFLIIVKLLKMIFL